MSVYCIINQTMRLSDPTKKIVLHEPLSYSNTRAHAFRVTVLAEGSDEPADLTGVGCTAQFYKPKVNQTVTPINGTVSGNVAEIILPASCYTTPGRFTFTMDLTQAVDPTDYPTFSTSTAYEKGDMVVYNGVVYMFTADHAAGAWTGTDAVLAADTRTALWVEGVVERTNGGTAIDPGTPVGNIEQAIGAAQAAASAATAAAADAEEAAQEAETAAQTAVTYAAQTGKTDAQKAQARTNIGAAPDYIMSGVRPEKWGAVGDGVTDDTNALLEAFQYAWQHRLPIILGAGKTYLTSRTLFLYDRIQIYGNQAIIKATATISQLIYWNDDITDTGIVPIPQFPDAKANAMIENLTLDGNANAGTCLFIGCLRGVTIRNVDICGFTVRGIYDRAGFEHFFDGVRIAGTGAVGEVGIYINGLEGDSRYVNVVTKNCEIGIHNEGGANTFVNLHSWNVGVANIPTSVMLKTSTPCRCEGCYADNVAVAFDVTQNVELTVEDTLILHKGNGWTGTGDPVVFRVVSAGQIDKIKSVGMQYLTPTYDYDLFSVAPGDYGKSFDWRGNNASSIQVMGNFPDKYINGSVSYDTEQALTDAEKTQARENIGSASQEALAQVENDVYSSENLTAFADPSNYTLTGYGGCRSYTGNSLAKYVVSAGQKLMLTIAKDWPYASNAEGVYQWQNADSVPANDNNPNLVGTPVTEAQNGTIVTVPEGATRLIVSHRTGSDTNVIKRISVKADDEIGKTNKAMRLFSFSDTFHSTLVESHGGSTNGTYAMNSMIGFRTAIKNGDKMIEGDIRITSDGVPVMFHDVAMNSTNISGWTGDPVYIGAMTYAQTQAYDLPKSSGKIPSLEDFLTLCKKQNVLVELDMAGKTWKSDESTAIFTQAEAFAIVLEVVDKCGMRDSVMFTGEYSGSTNQISAWMTVDTDVVIGVSNRTSASAVTAIDAIIQTYPLVVCSVGTSYTDSDLMDAIRTYGKKCKAKAFSIETLGEVDAAFNSGVDFCMSYAITQNAYNEYLLP